MVRELPCQPFMGQRRFCCHQQTRSILIDPVDDAGPCNSADTGQFAPSIGGAMVKKSVDQGAVWIARCRVDDHARRLVHNDQVFIFEYDIQRNVLRLRFGLYDRRKGNREMRARLHFGGGVGDDRLADRNSAFGHERLDALSRQAGCVGQGSVYASRCAEGAGDDLGAVHR